MNFDQLRYLIDIAKTGSINTTAKRLFTSQPAVSESIKRLEQELNGTILLRSKKGVELTDDGKFVLSHAIPMMAHYEELIHYFEKDQSAPHGIISIGIAALMTNTILSNLIFKMQEYYPNIALYTSESSFEQILEACKNEELDFGLFGVSPEFEMNALKLQYCNTCCFQLLYSSPIVCTMYKNNPLATYKTIDIINQNFSYTIYGSALPIFTTSNNCLHISSNIEIHKRFMQEKNTVCFLPKDSTGLLFAEKDFITLPLKDPISTTYYLVYRNDAELLENEIYQTFIHTIMELTKDII